MTFQVARPFMTLPFSMSGKKYLFRLISEYGKGWLLLGGVTFVSLFILGLTIHFKFLILAFLCLCIVLPLMYSFLYFYYGLQPISVLNSPEHKVFFKKDNLTLTAFFNKKDKKGNQDKSDLEQPSEKEFELKFSTIKRIKITQDGFLFFFGEKKREFLWIPFTAFQTKEDVEEITKVITFDGNEASERH